MANRARHAFKESVGISSSSLVSSPLYTAGGVMAPYMYVAVMRAGTHIVHVTVRRGSYVEYCYNVNLLLW